MKNYILTLVLFHVSTFLVISQDIEMKGVIINSETKKIIEFVNIGILDKNIGTVSNLEGEFNLEVAKKFSNDSLLISHLNYHSIKIPITNTKNQTIYLKPKRNNLSEVIISNKKKKQRKIGIKSYNPLLWVRAISKKNDMIETAQRINIPHQKVKVKYVNFYLRRGFKKDSTYLRVNFYNNINNKPGKKIIFENITQKIKIKVGWNQIDLTKNLIYLEEDFFIGLELIPDFKNIFEVYLGGILTKGRGFNRTSSQGTWNKLSGGSSINVEIEF